jgi:hypothetical protein
MMNDRSSPGTAINRAERFVRIVVFSIGGGILAYLFVITLFGERIHIRWLEQHMSDQQKQFATVIKKYHDSYEPVDDLKSAAYRTERANAICNLFDGNLSVVDWFGYVEGISRTSDGWVGLAVLLPTENNMPPQILFSGEKTLISPRDSFYQTILNLQAARSHYPVTIWSEIGGWFRGQPSFFSGQFMPSTKDCLQEEGTSNAMTEPKWLFKFSMLRPFIVHYVPPD